MYKFSFFISLMTVMLVSSAMAADSVTDSNVFPDASQQQYMQPNMRYLNAATFDNIHAYEGNVVATAKYVDVAYSIPVGKYLPAGADGENPFVDCTAGNYCPGNLTVGYNADNNQGLNACSALSDGSYTNSVSGATSENQCYKACPNSHFQHATQVSGNLYFEAGNTCMATACEDGYHVVNSLTNLLGTNNKLRSYYSNGSSIAPIGPSAYQSQDSAIYGGLLSASEPAFAFVYYDDNKTVKGNGRCSSVAGTNNFQTANPTKSVDVSNDGGDNCWCRLSKYKSGAEVENVDTEWVFATGLGAGECTESVCANYCAQAISYLSTFRSALFGAQYGLGCEPNMFSITWEGGVPGGSAQVPYGGDITTPTEEPIIKGKTFIGWSFD